MIKKITVHLLFLVMSIMAYQWEHFLVDTSIIKDVDGNVQRQTAIAFNKSKTKLWTDGISIDLTTGKLKKEFTPRFIRNIYVDNNDIPWLSSSSGGRFSKFENDSIIHLILDSSNTGVSDFTQDMNGHYWYINTFATDCYSSIDGVTFKKISTPFGFIDLKVDNRGDICGLGSSRITRYENGKWKDISSSLPSDLFYHNVAFDHNNTPYVAGSSKSPTNKDPDVLFKLTNKGTWESIAPPQGHKFMIRHMAFDSKGQLWIGTTTGLLKYTNSVWESWDHNDWGGYGNHMGTWASQINGIAIDSDDNIYIAAFGIHKLIEDKTSVCNNNIIDNTKIISANCNTITIKNYNRGSTNSKNSSVSIYSLTGKLLRSFTLIENNNSNVIEHNLPSGMYLLSIDGITKMHSKLTIR